MTRLACLLAVALSFATGCAVKPTEEECRKAIANMQRLMGTDNVRDDARIESEVRRCKGGSKKTAVECAIKAQTLDDLRACEFFKVPPGTKGLPNETPGAGSDTAGSAGSAAAGSAAAPTATGTGSATGSAAPTGSAASPGGAAGAGATGAGGAVGSAK